MTEPVVQIRDLTKTYGKVRALDSISFELAPGPIGLLGPNGAGKTTLLKLLLGLLEPDSGHATIAGHDPRTHQSRLLLRANVGYMPESDCLIPRMSAVELVGTLARLSGLTKTDSMTRAHEVLDYVGLDESRYRNCDDYSTGMKQRLKLAQALVHDPSILLLDEPTNGLDPKGRRHMLDLVWDLGHVQHKSLLLCSHLLPDVERCCRDVIVLKQGRVVAQGSIAGLTTSTGIRVRVAVAGEVERFGAELARRGLDPTREGASFVLALPADDCDMLFDAALATGASIHRVEPLRSTLEDAFMKSLADVSASVKENAAHA